nr:tetratricopeptide repeat protein 1-like isoform X5 [Malus domestica]
MEMLIKEEEGENECHSDMNPPNPSSSSSTATNRDASDGFETASDGELNDDEIPQQLHLQDEQQKTPSQNDDYVESKQEKYEDAIKECTKALELNPSYMKALLRRAETHEKLEHFEEAIVDMKSVLELDPSNDQAKMAIRRLGPLAEEKREKMKEEMIGKLKEMGNSLLGRFGMSVDNFKSVKDPNTGAYSLSFQR